MKTPLEIAIQSIESLDSPLFTAEDVRRIALSVMRSSLEFEKETMLFCFRQGQSNPLMLDSDWYEGQKNRSNEEV